MMCEACQQDEHWNCGMQTWCECDCDGPEGFYDDDWYDQLDCPAPNPWQDKESVG